MDPQWLVSICLVIFIIFIFIFTRKTKPQEVPVTVTSSSSPASAYSSFGGKHLEYSEEDLDRFMNRLNKVLFEAAPEPRKVAQHTEADSRSHGRGEKEQSHGIREAPGREPAHSQAAQPKVQERRTQPAAVEDIMDEIEQAVQETVESEMYSRRRHQQAGSRGHREGHWSEVNVKPEAGSL